VHVGRLGSAAGVNTQARLKTDEADAWHYSAQLAFASGTRRAVDLFQARRLAIIGMIVAGIGLLAATSFEPLL
jgi:hypothetical protein